MVGFSLKIPFDFLTAAGRSKSPGGGDGLAINILSPTNSFEAKGSGILRDDTLRVTMLELEVKFMNDG